MRFLSLIRENHEFLVEFTNDCLRAMCEADSGCVPKGCSRDTHGRLGCGYFRINIYQFKVNFHLFLVDDISFQISQNISQLFKKNLIFFLKN